ncbi:Tash1-or TashAT-like protein, putative [Theileria annulata]|uniref:Tash1-or TashAT-like protein, putative n=1 Tax=Theileria annulata TaxID=5874 RepID=Q4UHE7_THEAN|nr:Tash1-or TashAT-like protein, putative [Theileria annulata]CAI73492.1 Tash1-or TashAT-like protein, putative [Theileria annulata]|eukprot:XP_954169.1 Tash1-or TashAT-like protein, putative [Theileria annulata]
MVRVNTLLLVYAGFLYHIKIVSSIVLDLNDIVNSGLKIHEDSQDGIVTTKIYSTPEKKITKILNGKALVWMALPGEYVKCINIFMFKRCKKVLCTIEIENPRKTDIFYLHKYYSHYNYISKEEYYENFERFSYKQPKPKKKLGRPRKQKPEPETDHSEVHKQEKVAKPKRKRGRPRKQKSDREEPKRKRGRPRKHKAEERETDEEDHESEISDIELLFSSDEEPIELLDTELTDSADEHLEPEEPIELLYTELTDSADEHLEPEEPIELLDTELTDSADEHLEPEEPIELLDTELTDSADEHLEPEEPIEPLDTELTDSADERELQPETIPVEVESDDEHEDIDLEQELLNEPLFGEDVEKLLERELDRTGLSTNELDSVFEEKSKEDDN